jgi:hypothetical protein
VASRLEVATHNPASTPSVESRDWISHLDAHELDRIVLQFPERSECHGIAAARPTSTRLAWRHSASVSSALISANDE